MKAARTVLVVIAWILIVTVSMGVLLAWRSGMLYAFAADNEKLQKIGRSVESAIRTGAEKLNSLIMLQPDGNEISITEIPLLTGSGITGDGCDFDTRYYPYYGMISEREKGVYRAVYANAIAYESTFVPSGSISTGELKTAVEAVFNDHPELFWLDTGYSYLYAEGNVCVQVTLSFCIPAGELQQARERFSQAASRIYSGALALEDDYSKEKYVHNAILRSASYNADAAMTQSAYSALVLGETVCAGYARAFQYIMTQLGIPVYYCVGYTEGSHSWNIVCLDDGYYNVDLTWDDNIAATYSFFNRTDEDFSSTHKRTGLSVYLPECSASKWRNCETLFGGLADWINSKLPSAIPEPVMDEGIIQIRPSVPAGDDLIQNYEGGGIIPQPVPADDAPANHEVIIGMHDSILEDVTVEPDADPPYSYFDSANGEMVIITIG